MRLITRTIALFAILSLSAVAAWSQAKECTEEFKTATYSKWYDNRIEHQDVAFQAAEEYLAVCPNDDSPYATAIKKFHAAYKDLRDKSAIGKQFEEAFQKKNYGDQIRLGKQILAKEPDNSAVTIIMGVAGLGDANLLTESAPFAKKAIELIQSGKPIAPYTNKDQALAHLTYVVAKATAKTSPTDAIPYFVKAAKFESDLKKNALLYNELAGAYGGGPVAKFAKDYEAYIGKPESDESKLVLANLNQAIDRQIDAFARAAALSTDPADKKAVMEVLVDLNKGRNKSDAELNALVAGILSKPLPEPPTPITQLPTPTATPAPTATPTPTPASPAPGSAPTGGAAPGSNSKTSGGASSTASKTNTPSTSAPPATTAKPTATPKPKPRRNHRGH